MSHREKSLTPWLGPRHPDIPEATWDEATGRWSDDDPKTDDEKHMFSLRRRGVHATFLSPSIYDEAVAQGCDMRWFVKQQPMPIPGHGNHGRTK